MLNALHYAWQAGKRTEQWALGGYNRETHTHTQKKIEMKRRKIERKNKYMEFMCSRLDMC